MVNPILLLGVKKCRGRKLQWVDILNVFRKLSVVSQYLIAKGIKKEMCSIESLSGKHSLNSIKKKGFCSQSQNQVVSGHELHS